MAAGCCFWKMILLGLLDGALCSKLPEFRGSRDTRTADKHETTEEEWGWQKAQNNTSTPYYLIELKEFYFKTRTTNSPWEISLYLLSKNDKPLALVIAGPYNDDHTMMISWKLGDQTCEIGEFPSKTENLWSIDKSLNLRLNQKAIGSLNCSLSQRYVEEIKMHYSDSAQIWFKVAPKYKNCIKDGVECSGNGKCRWSHCACEANSTGKFCQIPVNCSSLAELCVSQTLQSLPYSPEYAVIEDMANVGEDQLHSASETCNITIDDCLYHFCYFGVKGRRPTPSVFLNRTCEHIDTSDGESINIGGWHVILVLILHFAIF